MLFQDMDARRQNDTDRSKLKRECVEIECKQSHEWKKRFDRTHAMVQMRLELDEKKAEVKVETQRLAMKERKDMIEFFAALANKLG